MSTADVLTVGHSTRDPGELERLLAAHGVLALVDVRAHPRSLRLPHFAREALMRSLAGAGIEYLHVPELGGRRRAAPGSPHGGWRNESFRAYADHMATSEFQRGLGRAEAAARERRTCLMCAEAPWWRCHRRLLADALTVRGWRVLHVLDDRPPSEHALTGFAVVRDGRLAYPPEQESLEL